MIVLKGECVKKAEEFLEAKKALGFVPQELTDEQNFKLWMIMDAMETNPGLIQLFEFLLMSFTVADITNKKAEYIDALRDITIRVLNLNEKTTNNA